MVWTDRNEANLPYASLAGMRYKRLVMTMTPNITSLCCCCCNPGRVCGWANRSKYLRAAQNPPRANEPGGFSYCLESILETL